MATKSLQLSCLCKGVSLTLSGQDKGAVICHCTNCKNFGGSAFAHNYRIMQAKVEYRNGQDLVRSYKDSATKSGNALNRFFCSRCGSSLMNVPEAIPGLTVACAGAIESGDDSMKPKFELFQEDKRSWMGSLDRAAKM